MGDRQEIYRSAMQLVEEEGADAVDAARLMSAMMREHGNPEMADVWESIRVAAIGVLAAQAVDGVTTH